MASILDRYGIKEVADVTFYTIDNDGKPKSPVLYLDTLKVSTIEQTAEMAEARGGKGNSALIAWDYGKEINVTLEDALFSAKSMAIMFGDGAVKDSSSLQQGKILKTWAVDLASVPNPTDTFVYGKTNIPFSKLTNVKYYGANTSESNENKIEAASLSDSNRAAFMTAEVSASEVGVIEVSANSFPGTYYVTGDTYARSETTGEDEFFQFIIQKAKVQSENTITLEAEGDPSVFNMSLKVLRPKDGIMMKLVKYNIDEEASAYEVKTTEVKVTAGSSASQAIEVNKGGSPYTGYRAEVADETIATINAGKVTGVKAGTTYVNIYEANSLNLIGKVNIVVS